MSHPPETSLTSLELAERLFNNIPRPAFDPNLSKELKDYLDRDLVKNTAIQSFSAIIDAWVRERELEAQVTSVTKILLMAEIGCFGYHPTGCRHCQSHDYRRELESALATARKQQETL